jgi:hypothetical protein
MKTKSKKRHLWTKEEVISMIEYVEKNKKRGIYNCYAQLAKQYNTTSSSIRVRICNYKKGMHVNLDRKKDSILPILYKNVKLYVFNLHEAFKLTAKECNCTVYYIKNIWYNNDSKLRKVNHPLIYQTKSDKVTLDNRKVISRNSKVFEQLCKEAKKKSK